MSRYARRKDANQGEIEKTLTDVGLPWVDTSRLGDGFPDLFVAVQGSWHALEVKVPGEDLTPHERGFHVKFRDYAPLHIVYSGQHALYCLGLVDTYEVLTKPKAERTRKTPRQASPAPRRRAKYADHAME